MENSKDNRPRKKLHLFFPDHPLLKYVIPMDWSKPEKKPDLGSGFNMVYKPDLKSLEGCKPPLKVELAVRSLSGRLFPSEYTFMIKDPMDGRADPSLKQSYTAASGISGFGLCGQSSEDLA